MTTPAYVDGIEVMWRPGCPFCMKLRGALKLRGVTTTEVDIWSTPEAAARVRDVADGNETVPTVFIGPRTRQPERAAGDRHCRAGVAGSRR